MKTKLIEIVIAATLSGSVCAGSTFGMPDCGQWINAPLVKKEQYKSWLLGWLSGANNELNQITSKGQIPPDILGQLKSAEQAFLFIDNYCRANPLKEVGAAADRLMDDLFDKKQKK